MTDIVEIESKVSLAECLNCPLKHGAFVPSEVVDGAEIMIIGEAPGKNEVLNGQPFVGTAGQVLRSVLDQLELTNVYVTNACLCYTYGTPEMPAVDCCRERLFAEVKGFADNGGRLVVPAGAVALKAFLGPTASITELQGSLLQWVDTRDEFSISMIPCFHPAALLRRSELFKEFIEALDKCKKFLAGNKLIDVQPEDFGPLRVGDNKAKADGYLRSLLRREGRLELDLETSGYSPYVDRILCMTLSERVDSLIHRYAFPADYIDWGILQEVVSKREMCFQNGQFDVQFLRSAGVVARIDQDTLLQMYVLDSGSKSLNLKTACRKRMNAPDWEAPLKDYLPTKSSSYELIPIDVLLEYGSLDAAYGLALSFSIEEDMDEDDRWVYNNILIPATNMFVETSRYGIAIDVPRIHSLKRSYSKRLEELLEQLREASGLAGFNPRSVKDARYLLYEKLGLPSIDGGYSTGRAVLEAYEREPAVALLKEFREKAKLLGTYLEGLLTDMVERRIHPNLKLFSTVTGRISSNNPNMLGLPKEKGGIRSLFIADEGRLLANMDFKAMELRVAAALSGDKNMMGAFCGGRDFHQEARERLFGKQDSYTHQQVLDAKTIVFGPLYGRGAYSLSKQLGCSVQEAQHYTEVLFEPFSHFMRWSDERVQEMRDTGEVRSHFGRKRRWGLITNDNFRDAEHEARNFPVQSAASDCNLLTMLKIFNTFDHNDLMPIIPIHDAILMSVRADRAEEIVKQAEEIACSYPSQLLNTEVPFAVDTDLADCWK